MITEECAMITEECTMVTEECAMVTEKCTMVQEECTMVQEECTMVQEHGHWSKSNHSIGQNKSQVTIGVFLYGNFRKKSDKMI